MLVYYTQRDSQPWLGINWIMKVNINVEIDTENKTDISTIEELIELIKKIKEQSDNE